MCRFISKELMTERERQGGVAALTALIKTPLKGAVNADGYMQTTSVNGSNGNGISNGSSLPDLPPEAYVWVHPAEQTVHQ
jgi:hypothetical protein